MLGGYLAKFMWLRRCTTMKTDPFDQILADIAEFYNPEEWKTYADADVFKKCSTEKKQRAALRKGIDLVSESVCLSKSLTSDCLLAGFYSLFAFFHPVLGYRWGLRTNRQSRPDCTGREQVRNHLEAPYQR